MKIEPVKPAPIRSSSQAQVPKKLRNPADRDFEAELNQANAATQMMGGQVPAITPKPLPGASSPEDFVVKAFSVPGDPTANPKGMVGMKPNAEQKAEQAALQSLAQNFARGMMEVLNQVESEGHNEGLSQVEVPRMTPVLSQVPELKVVPNFGPLIAPQLGQATPVKLKSTTPQNAGAAVAGLTAEINPQNLEAMIQAADTPSKLNILEGKLREMRGNAALGAMKEKAEPGDELPDLKFLQSPAPQVKSGPLMMEMSSNPVLQAKEFTQNGGAQLSNDFQIVGRPTSNSLQKNLSGKDFLNTLSMVQGGVGSGGEKSPLQPNLGNSQFENQADLKNQFGAAIKEKETELGLKTKKGQFGEDLQIANKLTSAHQPLGQTMTTDSAAGKKVIEVTAQVTSGAMTKERLSTSSLMDMSTGIRNLGLQGGGEMRVRLKPENLGELSLRIMTDGKSVGLQIQASDDKAKKVIEESMSFLKESLSAQHLTLGQVDVTLAGSSAQNHSNGNESSNDPRFAQSQTGNQDALGQNANQSQQHGGRSDQWIKAEGDAGLRGMTARAPVGLASGGLAGSASYGRGSAVAGRLDVKA
jgi:hypothetical protein